MDRRAPRILLLIPAALAAIVAVAHPARAGETASHAAQPRPAGGTEPGGSHAATLTVCTQNLWNYGLEPDVLRLRRSGAAPAKVAARLERQERELVARMKGCDLIAVQEIVGDETARAQEALDGLARRLGQSTGHRFTARVADTNDVIRNGFILRADGGLKEVRFEGAHAADALPRVRGFPRARWERGPAEILIEAGSGKGARRLRVITAHLKSKAEAPERRDPNEEKWERARVLQAAALLDIARRRLRDDPRELLLVAGDLNNVPASPTQEVATGALDPASLLSPRDCIDDRARLSCDLARKPADLINLTGADPDLHDRGSYIFEEREEMIDVILASPAAARLARESDGADNDWDIELVGRRGEGSDHLLLRVELALDGP